MLCYELLWQVVRKIRKFHFHSLRALKLLKNNRGANVNLFSNPQLLNLLLIKAINERFSRNFNLSPKGKLMGLDLMEVLDKERSNRWKSEKVNHLLNESLRQDEILTNAIKQRELSEDIEDDALSQKMIYELEEIKKVCVDYRLRFLDAKLFKGDIPLEVLLNMRNLEEEMKAPFKSFKIVAPAELFKLVEKDKDPILFGQLSDNKYYFIGKWGKDMSSMRKWLVYPFRDISTFIKSIFILTVLISFSLPSSWMVTSAEESSFSIRMVLFFYVLFATTAWSILYAYPRVKNFNANLWNSRFFD